MMNNHEYVEASYLILNLRAQLSRTVVDPIAARSLAHRLDNVQSFLDYLNEEGLSE